MADSNRVKVVRLEYNGDIDWNGKPVDDESIEDNLNLTRINEDSTVGEMIDTINSNFENIAKHGGGPSGLDGKNGKDGTNGVNSEYIYARADVMNPNYHYPTNDVNKELLFDEVISSEAGHSSYNNNIDWYSFPQGVDQVHKNEYVLARYKKSADDTTWYYAQYPVLWAHWGETGMDGNGVEYIFIRKKAELTDSEINNLHKSITTNLNTAQKAICNIDDFYPGEGWFNEDNESSALKAYQSAGLNVNNFPNLWNTKFGFLNYEWTDEPLGTTPIYKYEYVSIRKSSIDKTSGKKNWGPYSKPSLWSSYGYATRTFIVYYNNDGTKPQKPEKGWWNVDEDKLITNRTGYELTPGWSDTNIDTDGTVTWMSSGVFGYDGKNISWSDPVRITGENGRNGEDGTKIQFIYALTSDPKYPESINDKKKLFDTVETNKSDTYNGTVWHDNAQSISETNKEEYFASRIKSDSETWIYSEPALWARWGEDGTDGDGVEYIFHTSKSKDINAAFYDEERQKSLDPRIGISNPTSIEKVIYYNIDDFYPGEGWFNKEGQRERVKQILQDKLGEAFNEEEFNSKWVTKFGFDKGWTDNPMGTKASEPFEWVSIRKSSTPEGTKEKVWGEFSEPKLWASYNVTAMTFTVYCNLPEGVEPDRIPDGEGRWGIINNKLVNKDNPNEFTYRASSSDWCDLDKHIGMWEDDNNDVKPSDYPDGVEMMIKWVSTGRFKEDGDDFGSNISWSKPMRITGDQGKPGEDGEHTQYIYALVNKYVLDNEDCPWIVNDDDTTKEDRKDIFDQADAEGHYKHESYSITWYDNPQGISEENKIEWIWSRHRKSEEDEWEYGDPSIWSRWGEDGTDGDGVEYIFFATSHNPLVNSDNPNITFDDTQLNSLYQIVYQFEDFYPNKDWFTDTIKDEVHTKFTQSETISDTDWNDLWNRFINFFEDKKWADNPSGVDKYRPFEWVSIRKSKPGDNGKRVWEPFSEPKLWGKFNIRTRDFIVYCNMEGEAAIPVKPNNYSSYGRYEGFWNVTGVPTLGLNASDFSKPFKSNALPDGQLPKKNNTSESSSNTDDWTNHIGYWGDTNEDVDGTIAWMCTGTFSETGDCISWSEPFRITGYKGQPGADGETIHFIYALSDDEPKYPKYNNLSDYETVNSFFNNIESAGVNGYEYKYKLNPSDETEESIIWYDNAQAIADEDGKRKEWVWSRSKAAGASTTNWTFAPKPVIWAHWGEDGTDGDGIEYIFTVRPEEWTPDSSVWTTATQISSNIEKAMYSIGDFVPYENWFSDDNKTKVKNILTEKNQYNYNTDEEFDTAWGELKNKWSFNKAIESGRTELGAWSDNPNSIGPGLRYQYVSIRKMSAGVWGPFSYPKLWSKYSLSKFTSFAFITLHIDEDISNLTPEGGTYLNPIPNDLKRTNEGIINCAVDESGISWTDTPQVPDETEVVWMSSAQFDEGTNGPSTSWSVPQRMVDSSTFNVEWSSTDLSRSEIEQINDVLSGKYTDDVFIDGENRESTYFNFGTVLKDVFYNVDEAEREWRIRIDKLSSELIRKNLSFGDDTGKAVLMATCQLKNGEWSNWVIKRIKGEQGEKGDPGTSINVKGKIIYEVYFDSDETVYNYTTASNAKQTYIEEKFASELPSKNGLLIVYPKSLRETYNDYWGENPDGKLYMWKYDENGAWHDFNNTDKTIYDNKQEEGDCYTSQNKHLILWDGDSWQDVGELQGPEGSRWILVIKYANGTPSSREFVEDDIDIPSAEWIGTFMYLDDGTDHSANLDNANYTASGDSTTEKGWIWSLFKGQDGHGLEYIFKATPDNQPPYVPNTSVEEDRKDDAIPTSEDENNVRYGWSDEPIEPTPEKKYVWMCWRKFNKSNQTWTKFMGVDKKTYDADSDNCGVARLWQVYANAIEQVDEYFHVDTSISPDDLLFTTSYNELENNLPNGWNDYWKTDKDEWDKDNPYLFNREVITYSTGKKKILDPHYLAVWDKGIKDVKDYYIIHTSGDVAPHMNGEGGHGTPEIKENPGAGDIAGITYWIDEFTEVPKLTPEYKYLWNISYKTYADNNLDTWTTPLVIGVYDLGADAVYLELDNEMDTVQVNEAGVLLSDQTLHINLKLYKGGAPIKIKKCEISGEDSYSGNITVYYSQNNEETNASSYDENETGNYDFSDLENGVDSIHIEINLYGLDSNEPTTLSSEPINLRFVVTALEKTKNNDDITAMASYKLMGITLPSVYSIIPSVSAVLFNQNNQCVPPNLTFTVLEKTGSMTTEYSTASSTDPFVLSVAKNDESSTPYTSGSFSYSTSNLSIGDKLTVTVAVDADNNDENGKETVVDRETIYVIREGQDGKRGPAGKGYEYKYIRYEGATYCYISNTPDDNLHSDNPVFTVRYGDTTSNVYGSTIAGGADSTYQYEWRSERTTDTNGSWGSWSDPITIARYFDTSDMSTAVNSAITNQTSTIATNVKNYLSTDFNRLNTLSGYFDGNGVLQCSGIASSLLSGYIQTDNLGNAITTVIAGVSVSSDGKIHTFSDYMNTTTSKFNSVNTSLDAINGSLSNYVTSTDLEGSISTAMDTFKADVKDNFASMDRVVANVNNLRDEEGYLLIEKSEPNYGTLSVTPGDPNYPVYIIPEYGISVEDIMKYCNGQKDITKLPTSVNIHNSGDYYYILSHFDSRPYVSNTYKFSYKLNRDCNNSTSPTNWTHTFIGNSDVLFKDKFVRLNKDTSKFNFTDSNDNTNREFQCGNFTEDYPNTSEIYDSVYCMYVNSLKDEIKINYSADIEFSTDNSKVNMYIRYKQDIDGEWKTYQLYSWIDKSGTKRLSISSYEERLITIKDINDSSDKITTEKYLYFQFYITFDFNSIESIDTSYSFTTVNKIGISSTDNYVNKLNITTLSDGITRQIGYNPTGTANFPSTYIIDKVKVSYSNGTPTSKSNETIRYRAHSINERYGSNKSVLKDYLGADDYGLMLDSEKDYLIPITKEMSSISQSVSNGIACTSIITSVEDKHAVFVQQATSSGTSIYMNANEIGIKSDYFNLDNNGLSLTGNITLRSKNGVTRLDENGVLYASGAVISGEITTDKLIAESTMVEADFTNGSFSQYSGTITKRTSINNSSFGITVNGTLTSEEEVSGDAAPDITINNAIYFEILNEYENLNGSADYNSAFPNKMFYVPTLTMMYNGEAYVLNPATWIKRSDIINNASTSNMRWVFVCPILIYTYNGSSQNNQVYTKTLGASGNNYSCRIFYKPSIMTTELTNLYRINVFNLGETDDEKSTNLGLLKSHNLISYTGNNTDLIYINPTCAFAQQDDVNSGDVGNNAGQQTVITKASCTRFSNALPKSNFTCGRFYEKEYVNPSNNDWNVNNVYNLFKAIVAKNDEIWLNGSNPYICTNLENKLPFESGVQIENSYKKLHINYYPIFEISNGGKTVSNSISKLYLDCRYELYGSYIEHNDNKITVRHATYENNPYLKSIMLWIEFKIYIPSISINNFSPFGELQSDIETKVKNIIESMNFYNYNQPDLSLVDEDIISFGGNISFYDGYGLTKTGFSNENLDSNQ